MKLPKNISITQLNKNKFVLEYREFSWEPTLGILSNKQIELINFAEENKLKIGLCAVYVRNGCVCIGASFKGNLNKLNKQFSTHIFEHIRFGGHRLEAK